VRWVPGARVCDSQANAEPMKSESPAPGHLFHPALTHHCRASHRLAFPAAPPVFAKASTDKPPDLRRARCANLERRTSNIEVKKLAGSRVPPTASLRKVFVYEA